MINTLNSSAQETLESVRSDIIKKWGEIATEGESESDASEFYAENKTEQELLNRISTSSKSVDQMKPLTAEKLAAFQKQLDKTGIVYLSRIPPFMKPLKVRHLLEKFGKIGHIYLAPEDPKIRLRRKKYGGNKKKNYTEGWVEFLDKKVAKNFYHDDLWNIKYLPKFKWNHLTEQIAYENASRAQRLQAEISQARRENKDYVKKVEKSKMIKSMQEKKLKKRKTTDESLDMNSDDINDNNKEDEHETIRRKFKQRKLISSELNLEIKHDKVSHENQRNSSTISSNNSTREIDPEYQSGRLFVFDRSGISFLMDL
ncbi:5333_t:CDS:2 [Ambispora gerdemannii]|uniref:5333_t:CDS:1 n=1 Tax=Ambispora gerdemannii TaxID=144530 RepID=A0A9N9BWU1_9GLOM|nr:5333_t:CDS:2 [Ambispora gerdemannii]